MTSTLVQRSLTSLKAALRPPSQFLALNVPGVQCHVTWIQHFYSTGNRRKESDGPWYIYGIILPIKVNKNYLVVKVGRSQQHQVAKRFYNIHNKFSQKYGPPVFKNPPQQGAETDTVIERARNSSNDELFLLSEIAGTENDSNFAEREAREVLGVKQLVIDPTESLKASKETEWILVPTWVISKVREAQRNGEMDHFNKAKDFAEKLRNCTDKCYVKFDISLGEIRTAICVPDYNKRS